MSTESSIVAHGDWAENCGSRSKKDIPSDDRVHAFVRSFERIFPSENDATHKGGAVPHHAVTSNNNADWMRKQNPGAYRGSIIDVYPV